MEKKIFFVIASLEFGGAERVLSEIANYLAENDYEVTIITFFRGEKEYILDKSVRRINLDIPTKKFSKLCIGRKRLSDLLKKEKVDLCISFDILANILLILSHPSKCKTVISERNAPKHTRLSIYSRLLRIVTYDKADGCVFQTEEAKKCYSKKLQNKSWIIPNPVRRNLPYRCEKELRNEIIAIGRLDAQKNYIAMIKGFARFAQSHDDYVLKIYGQGNMQSLLEEFAIECGVGKKVFFKGSSLNVHSEIMHSKIFLMTSNYEGIPNALMEAMAMGFPVIAYDCPSGGVKLLINNMTNGILINDQQPETIECALNQIVEDEILEKRLGENARSIRILYSLEKIGKCWIDLIESYDKEMQ